MAACCCSGGWSRPPSAVVARCGGRRHQGGRGAFEGLRWRSLRARSRSTLAPCHRGPSRTPGDMPFDESVPFEGHYDATTEEGGDREEHPPGTSSSAWTPANRLDVLYRDQNIAAICKPPLMHVHRPEFGSRDPEFVLQLARDQLGQPVYFPHRLDRGTSGCLLLAFSPVAVKVLQAALTNGSGSCKTYVAVVRGSGKAFRGRGWITVERPIKDEKGVRRPARTRFLFLAGGEGGGDTPGPRCSLVVAQPSTGRANDVSENGRDCTTSSRIMFFRYHQIRRHLNGLSHPVVGDTQHGDTRFNRHVATEHGAPPRRLLLHCLNVHLPSLPRPDAREWSVAVGNRSPDAHDEEPEGIPGSPGDPTVAGEAAVLDRATEGVLRPGVYSRTWEKSSHASDHRFTVAERQGESMTRADGFLGVSESICVGSRGSAEQGGSDRTGSDSLATGSYGRCDETRGRGSEGEGMVSRAGSTLRNHGGVAMSESGVPSPWGLRVSCPPPEDFVAFLRRVPGVDEGCIASLLRGVAPGA